MVMTLVSSAKRHDLDIGLYLKDVLDQLLAGSTDYHRLLPRPMETKSSGSHSPLSGGRAASTKRNGSSTGQHSGDSRTAPSTGRMSLHRHEEVPWSTRKQSKLSCSRKNENCC